MVHHRIAQPNAPADLANDVTEIIALGEFGAMLDMPNYCTDPLAIELAVLNAPELDDLNDVVDESPRLLLSPRDASKSEPPTVPIPVGGARLPGSPLPSHRALSGATVRASCGAHRKIPPATARRTAGWSSRLSPLARSLPQRIQRSTQPMRSSRFWSQTLRRPRLPCPTSGMQIISGEQL